MYKMARLKSDFRVRGELFIFTLLALRVKLKVNFRREKGTVRRDVVDPLVSGETGTDCPERRSRRVPPQTG